MKTDFREGDQVSFMVTKRMGTQVQQSPRRGMVEWVDRGAVVVRTRSGKRYRCRADRVRPVGQVGRAPGGAA